MCKKEYAFDALFLYHIQVRELGNPKNKKGKDVPPFSDICESCKVYLDANQPIPVSLVAKLIKWKMLILKDIDMKRRAALAKVRCTHFLVTHFFVVVFFLLQKCFSSSSLTQTSRPICLTNVAVHL